MEKIKKHIGVHHLSSVRNFILIFSIITLGGGGIYYASQIYPRLFPTEINIEKETNVYPEEMVAIDFSMPMLAQKYAQNIKIYPSEGVRISWENSNRRLVIRPQEFWQVETDYTITLPEGRNAMFNEVSGRVVSFSTIRYPRVTNISPASGAKDVLIDIEDPVVVDFDKSTEGFFVDFVFSPHSEMNYQNNLKKTQFKLLPKNKIEDGRKYEIKIFVRYTGDGNKNSKEIFASSFETLMLPPQEWEKDLGLRLTQAKKYTKPKINDGKYIDVNLKSQIMSIFENGQLVESFLISSGKRGMETPPGNHRVYNKHPRPWSKAYGLFMPFWMAIVPDGKMGIHELPEWPGGYKEGANHLGIPVSHGCIRLGIGAAERVYNWADIGTPIIVYSS